MTWIDFPKRGVTEGYDDDLDRFLPGPWKGRDRTPWLDEGERERWVDETTNFACAMRRGPLGSWSGYVGVDGSHPLHSAEAKWDDERFETIEVHGGITFADLGHNRGPGIISKPPLWWFGFDTAHSGDYVPGMYTPRYAKLLRAAGIPTRSQVPDPPWGPDVYRRPPYIKEQCTNLAAQLFAAGSANAAQRLARLIIKALRKNKGS